MARAHALTLPTVADNTSRTDASTTLHALVQAVVSPYDGQTEAGMPRFAITGPDLPIAGSAATSLALLLHEFATNATKYGALSSGSGQVAVECSEEREQFVLTWHERGGPPVVRHAEEDEGFGSLLARMTVRGQLGGSISRDWKPEGLTIRLAIDRGRIGIG